MSILYNRGTIGSSLSLFSPDKCPVFPSDRVVTIQGATYLHNYILSKKPVHGTATHRTLRRLTSVHPGSISGNC